MSTKAFGYSDDVVAVESERFNDEFSAYGRDEANPKIVAFSDGTILEAFYPKNKGLGVWGIKVVKAGILFDRIDPCFDEDADPHSDIAHFRDGITNACEHANSSDLRKERVIVCPHCDETIQTKTCECCGLFVGEKA